MTTVISGDVEDACWATEDEWSYRSVARPDLAGSLQIK